MSPGLAESRIPPAVPQGTRPRTPLISFCTVQLRTLCTAHSLATLCPSTTSGPDLEELPGFWGSMVFRYAPIPRKGSGNQQQQPFYLEIKFLYQLLKHFLQIDDEDSASSSNLLQDQQKDSEFQMSGFSLDRRFCAIGITERNLNIGSKMCDLQETA